MVKLFQIIPFRKLLVVDFSHSDFSRFLFYYKLSPDNEFRVRPCFFSEGQDMMHVENSTILF